MAALWSMMELLRGKMVDNYVWESSSWYLPVQLTCRRAHKHHYALLPLVWAQSEHFFCSDKENLHPLSSPTHTLTPSSIHTQNCSKRNYQWGRKHAKSGCGSGWGWVGGWEWLGVGGWVGRWGGLFHLLWLGNCAFSLFSKLKIIPTDSSLTLNIN